MQITAVCVDNFLLVVTPLQALRALTVLAGQVEFWRSALGSLWRIAAGFLLGAVLGLLLAAVSYRYHLAEEILRPFMVFCKAVPVAVFAVLLLIWWGASRWRWRSAFRGVSEYLSEHTGRLKKCGRRTDRDGRSVSSTVCHPLFLYLPSGIKAIPAQRISIIPGNELEIRSGSGSDRYAVAFHRRSTVSGEDLPRYGGSVSWTAVIIVLSVLFEKIVFGCVEYFFGGSLPARDRQCRRKMSAQNVALYVVADFGKMLS